LMTSSTKLEITALFSAPMGFLFSELLKSVNRVDG
jgi:hypothetical protein